MTTYIMIGSFLLFCVVLMAWNKLGNNSKPQDSALKQRAIFNLNEQLTFTRLIEVLPDSIIRTYVYYDALTTPIFIRTGHKYRDLSANFVIMDQLHQIIAIVAVDDPLILKRPQQTGFPYVL